MPISSADIICTNCICRKGNVLGGISVNSSPVFTMNTSCMMYKKGDLIFHEGQYADGLHCITQGKVKLYKTGHEGKDQIVRLCKAGDVLGYRAVVSSLPYSASASALENSFICKIPQQVFFDQIEQNPDMALSLIRILSQDLRKAEQRMVVMAQKTVRERLAETLIILRETYGSELGSNIINVSLSREELASIVGTATETVIRLLADFKKEGWIDTRGRKISLNQPEALLKAGNLRD
jgi:CRP/FNR family transcriptional regulator, polysaccharide utilization system transcription regulator